MYVEIIRGRMERRYKREDTKWKKIDGFMLKNYIRGLHVKIRDT